MTRMQILGRADDIRKTFDRNGRIISKYNLDFLLDTLETLLDTSQPVANAEDERFEEALKEWRAAADREVICWGGKSDINSLPVADRDAAWSSTIATNEAKYRLEYLIARASSR